MYGLMPPSPALPLYSFFFFPDMGNSVSDLLYIYIYNCAIFSR